MKSIKNLQNNFIKFHGCGLYRKDGTNILCTKKRPCLKPINNCFWMKSKDTTNKIRTRNKELNDEILMSNSLKNEYFQKLYIMKSRQYYSSDESSYSDSDSDTSISDSNPDISDSDSDSNKLIIDFAS